MTPPIRSDDPHRWCRLRMPALRLGLLEDADEARLQDHLASCASCRDAYAVVTLERTPGDARGEHIPADLIAGWPRAAATIRGIERAAVRHHLGHEPKLERIAALEPLDDLAPAAPLAHERSTGLGAAQGPGAGVAPTERTIRVLVRPAKTWRKPIQWAIGGWAVAASAAALILVVRPVTVPPGSEPSRSSPASSAGVGSSSPPAAGPASIGAPGTPSGSESQLLLAAVPEVSLALRGGDGVDSIAGTRIAPDTRVLLLPTMTEALADLTATTRVRVELIAPSGHVLLRETISLARLRDKRVLVYDVGGSPLESGTYSLRFAGGGEVVEARFRLDVSAKEPE